MFGLFKKKSEKSKKIWEMDINDIRTLENRNDFVIAMNSRICKKCAYRDNIDALSNPERVFYITQQCEAEVNNGGFSQYIFNSSGNFSRELVQAFSKKALDAFGRELPSDRNKRQEVLEELNSDEIDRTLEECDDAFFEYEDDLLSLNFAYVQKNKDSFK